MIVALDTPFLLLASALLAEIGLPRTAGLAASLSGPVGVNPIAFFTALQMVALANGSPLARQRNWGRNPI
jgi:hypothetical protein